MAIGDVVTVQRPQTLGDLLLQELGPEYCRTNATVLAGSTYNGLAMLAAGTIMARQLTAAPIAAGPVALAGNVGNGVLTPLAAGAVNANAQTGQYGIRIVKAAAGGGRFDVFRPNGSFLGRGLVGTAWNTEINFTLAAGATDFAVGDGFTIAVTVALGSLKWVPLAPGASDGTQIADGVLMFAVTVPALADAQAVILRRAAIVNQFALIHQVGATATDIANNIEALRNLPAGIVARPVG